MSESIVNQKVPFKNLGLSRVSLVPTRVLNPDATDDPIVLRTTGKSLPGFLDAPTWEIVTDDPDQEVAEKIKGKMLGMQVLEFTETYDPIRLAQLAKHHNSELSVVMIYDDQNLDYIAAITIPGCELVNPGHANGGETNSRGEMVIRLQPRGGGKVSELIQVELTQR